MSELEKKISTAKMESHEPPQHKLNYVKLDIGTKNATPVANSNASEPDKTTSRIPIKPKPPVLASKPNIAPVARTVCTNKKPLIPQRPTNVIYSKPKCPPPTEDVASSKQNSRAAVAVAATEEPKEKPKVQHLARKFSALGKGKTHNVTRKTSDPTGLSSEQQAKLNQNTSPCKDSRRKTLTALTTVTESEEKNKNHNDGREHSCITKTASAETSQQTAPPQILISETVTVVKHGSQDSGIGDCSMESNGIQCNQSVEGNKVELLSTPSVEEVHAHKHGSYLKVEYQKPTNSTIEAFNIHLFDEEEEPSVAANDTPAVAMYGSAQTDDEKVQYMYFNGSQESSCTVNSTDNDGYSLMKCPNKRLSSDTYVEINNLTFDNEELLRRHKRLELESIRVEPGYLAAYQPETTEYVDQHCNPVKREDYCEDDWDESADSFNSIATLPHPKSPRKLSLIKDSNGYIHEEHLPIIESTVLRRLVCHGNRLGSGELYSYAKVPGIIIPTLNKDEPLPAWGIEPHKKKSVLKKPPPIQPKSDSIRRSIMQHHYNNDHSSNRHTLGYSPDDSGGSSPNGFSSLDGPIFIDKFKTLETFGRDRSFSEFHTLDQKPVVEKRQQVQCSSVTMDEYVSNETVMDQQNRGSKGKRYKKPYKLPPNVTSSYVTVGAPAEYEIPCNNSEDDVTPVTSPPLSPPKPTPAPRKQHIIDNLPTVTRSTSRDRSKSLHDFTDTLDLDSQWKHPIRERAKLVSRRKRKALKRTYSSENVLEHSNRNENSDYNCWNKSGTFDTSGLLSDNYSFTTELDSTSEHSESFIDHSSKQPIRRRVPLNDSIAKQKMLQRSCSQEDINYLATITGYDIPQFRTKKPYVNLPPIITANIEIGPINFTMGTDNIYDVPRVPPTVDITKDTSGGEAECTYSSGTFTHKGGMLTSAGSGVQIEIPEGAIARGKTQQIWFAVCQEIEGLNMNTIDSRMQSNSRMFEQGRNRIEVTPRVLVGPSGVTFLKPIRIIIPHCISPLHASWQFTALVRKEDSNETNWEKVCQQTINPLWSKKPHRQHVYRHSKYQLMLHEVMFTSLYPGWFVLAGEAIRSGQRAAKIMTLVIYCSKQEFENINQKLTMFVLLANNTVDDRKVIIVITSYYIIIT